jgi:hypothetical protein
MTKKKKQNFKIIVDSTMQEAKAMHSKTVGNE